MRHTPVNWVAEFDGVSDVYDERFGTHCAAVHSAVLAVVRQSAQEPQSILDIGCGTGSLLCAAAAQWPAARLTGVEPSEGMAHRAREKVPGATIHVASAENLPLAAESVDLVLSTTSFGHWHDRRAGMLEVARTLRPGGRVYLAEHVPPGVVQRLLMSLPLCSPRGLVLPDYAKPDEVRSLFQHAGLKVLRQATAVWDIVLTIGAKE